VAADRCRQPRSRRNSGVHRKQSRQLHHATAADDGIDDAGHQGGQAGQRKVQQFLSALGRCSASAICAIVTGLGRAASAISVLPKSSAWVGESRVSVLGSRT